MFLAVLWLQYGPSRVQNISGARAGGQILVVLMIASAVAGALLGRFLRAYALIPATMLILVAAWYLGLEQGFATGLIAFVASAVILQVVYCASLLIYLLIANLSVLDQVQSEASPQMRESRIAV
ncbi:hypothetical protein XH94_04595 [Bradyrhizobium zhanjiangense]|uniref:Uncharacterized protein n=1 Tax=Bradyrhizobium zhanjiangense TaxID=1325107 RepID=A0A4V1L4L9_9BRAD|nr:hypothetical protein XH94_04595 [Bradyrhizobium zhanjiangense]